MLSFSPGLAPLGTLAGQHHERLDGSGYPRGRCGDAISSAGRILAAADSYHARTEDRRTGRRCLPRTEFCTLDDGVAAYRQLTNGELAVLPGTAHVITAAKIELALDFLGRHLQAS
jgi:hypothetical protein